MSSQIQLYRIQLPSGVNFEVPRDYALSCGGQPVRVTQLGQFENDVLVSAGANVLSFTHGNTIVEFDLSSILGFVINLKEEIAHAVLCTLRIAFIGKDGLTSLLPVFSANPSKVTVFEAFISRLTDCALPVPIYSSVQDLLARATRH